MQAGRHALGGEVGGQLLDDGPLRGLASWMLPSTSTCTVIGAFAASAGLSVMRELYRPGRRLPLIRRGAVAP